MTGETYREEVKAALHTNPLIRGELHVVDCLVLLLLLFSMSHLSNKLVDELPTTSVQNRSEAQQQNTY